MKRANLLLVLLLVGLVGCTYNSLPDDMATPVAVSEQGFDLTFSTRAEAFDGQSLDNTYFVAEEDLESYLNYKQKHSGKKINIKNYSAYGFDNSHTLFYVINYDKGWEVVSADKRTQPTLAYGEGERTFSMGADNTNEAEKLWMDMLASDVLQKRQRGKGARTSDTEEIANDEERARVDYWNRICSDKTRAIEISSASELPWSHNWYILGTTTDSVYVEKGPYIQTQWNQEDPWNVFCPLKTDGIYRAPAGCASVAGGQLMYYLQHRTGAYMPIPISAEVNGDVNNHQFTFSTTTSNAIWSAMAKDFTEFLDMQNGPTQLVAVLLAWIGSNIDMRYGDSGSRTTSSKLFNWLNMAFGITYSNCSYNSSILKEELNDKQCPIYIEGERIATPTNKGHAWLADGFKVITRVDTVYYIVTEEDLTTEELMQYTFDDATHYINYELEDSFIHMNWGASNTNNGYYSIAKSEWAIHETPYDTRVSFYYDFNL